jgi:hypothetical protein
MKSPLQKIIADYPDNKIEFVWKNKGQLTHIIVDGKRLGFTGLSRSVFGLLQYHDVSVDEEVYNVLKAMVDSIVKSKF